MSAQFVAPTFCVTTSESPELLRDAETAELASQFRVRGSLALARKVIEHLLPAKLKVSADPSRGLDHGAWLPLSMLFPDASMPVVQVSLQQSLDPDAHFALGRALEPLRGEGILILGSGAVTYELLEIEKLRKDPAAPDILGARSRRFESWVTDLLIHSAPYVRARGLTRFREHPDASAVHARGEQFLPLVVVAGAASRDMPNGNEGALIHAGSQRGTSLASFAFGGPE